METDNKQPYGGETRHVAEPVATHVHRSGMRVAPFAGGRRRTESKRAVRRWRVGDLQAPLFSG